MFAYYGVPRLEVVIIIRTRRNRLAGTGIQSGVRRGKPFAVTKTISYRMTMPGLPEQVFDIEICSVPHFKVRYSANGVAAMKSMVILSEYLCYLVARPKADDVDHVHCGSRQIHCANGARCSAFHLLISVSGTESLLTHTGSQTRLAWQLYSHGFPLLAIIGSSSATSGSSSP